MAPPQGAWIKATGTRHSDPHDWCTGRSITTNVSCSGGTAGDYFLSSTVDYASLGFAGVFQKPVMKQQLLAVIKSKLG